MAEQPIGDILLTNVRITFPTLFTAKAVKAGDKPSFGASFLMPKDHPDVAKVKAALRAVAEAKWGAKAPDILKSLVTGQRVCLRDGDTKAEYEGYPGNLFVSSTSSVRPTTVHRDRSPLTEGDGVIYSGCYVNAKINIWAQDNQHGKRLNAQLQGVQFARDGEAFSGGGKAAAPEDFADMGGVDAADEFAGGDAGGDALDDLI